MSHTATYKKWRSKWGELILIRLTFKWLYRFDLALFDCIGHTSKLSCLITFCLFVLFFSLCQTMLFHKYLSIMFSNQFLESKVVLLQCKFLIFDYLGLIILALYASAEGSRGIKCYPYLSINLSICPIFVSGNFKKLIHNSKNQNLQTEFKFG